MSKTNRCRRCSLAFSSKTALNRHVRDKHRSYYYSVRVAPVLLAALILGMIGVYAGPLVSNPPKTTTTPVEDVWNKAFPVVTSNGLSSPVKLNSILRGRPALLEFMVSWCTHCQKMAPAVEDLQGKYGGSISFMSVAGAWGGANVNSTADFIRIYGANWTHVFDANNEVFNHFNVTQTPTYLLLNSKGEVVNRMVGEVSKEALASELQKLG